MVLTPCSCATDTIARASAIDVAIGFSHQMCLPDFAAASAISQWVKFGVQMLTTSISSASQTSRQSPVTRWKSKRFACRSRVSSSVSNRATNSTSIGQLNVALPRCQACVCVPPMKPMPKTPTRNFSSPILFSGCPAM